MKRRRAFRAIGSIAILAVAATGCSGNTESDVAELRSEHYVLDTICCVSEMTRLPEGQLVVAGGGVAIYDVGQGGGQPLTHPERGDDWVIGGDLAVSRGGQWIAVDDGELIVWDVWGPDSPVVLDIDTAGSVVGLDSERLIATGPNGVVEVAWREGGATTEFEIGSDIRSLTEVGIDLFLGERPSDDGAAELALYNRRFGWASSVLAGPFPTDEPIVFSPAGGGAVVAAVGDRFLLYPDAAGDPIDLGEIDADFDAFDAAAIDARHVVVVLHAAGEHRRVLFEQVDGDWTIDVDTETGPAGFVEVGPVDGTVIFAARDGDGQWTLEQWTVDEVFG